MAFTAIVAVAAVDALSPKYGGGSNEQQQAAKAIPTPNPPTGGAVVEGNPGSDLTKPCEEGEENRHSDLCAQWKAADAAKESADWTRRTFGLGVFGTLIGGLTLLAASFAAKYARDAATHTKTGADAAIATVNLAKSTTRAWVKLSAEVVDVIDHGRPNEHNVWETHIALLVKFTTKNVGVLPAFGVKVWILEDGGPDEILVDAQGWIDRTPVHAVAGVTLFPNEEFRDTGQHMAIHRHGRGFAAKFCGSIRFGGLVAYFLDKERKVPAYTPCIFDATFDTPDKNGRFTKWSITQSFHQVSAT